MLDIVSSKTKTAVYRAEIHLGQEPKNSHTRCFSSMRPEISVSKKLFSSEPRAKKYKHCPLTEIFSCLCGKTPTQQYRAQKAAKRLLHKQFPYLRRHVLRFSRWISTHKTHHVDFVLKKKKKRTHLDTKERGKTYIRTKGGRYVRWFRIIVFHGSLKKLLFLLSVHNPTRRPRDRWSRFGGWNRCMVFPLHVFQERSRQVDEEDHPKDVWLHLAPFCVGGSVDSPG